jgi:uncharacterized protein (TIGR02301 family)
MTETARRAAGPIAALLLTLLAAGQGAAAPTGGDKTRAAPRAPEQRQVLTELAFVLGEAHALRRVCNGPSDGFLYERMNRLLAIEQPEDAFRRQLIERFNAGFVTAGAAHASCSTISRTDGRNAALQGKILAERLFSGDAERAVSH